MKPIATILAVILFVSVATVSAQTPTPDPDTVSSPVKQTDPEVDVMPRDINYAGGMIRITPDQLPKAVKQTLETFTVYDGWQKGKTYKDKEGKLFLVEINEADRTRVFRFDRNGKPFFD